MQKNKLVTGSLQLGQGTFIIIDETKLSEGELSDLGIIKLKQINEILAWQKLQYDFHYHTVEFHTDYQIIILSHGKSLFLRENTNLCQIPIQHDENYQSDFNFSSEMIKKFRLYIALVKSLNLSNLDDSISNEIQTDFVTLRQEDEAITIDLFHLWLTIVRLYTISLGEVEITLERWADMKKLEYQRLERLAKHQKDEKEKKE